MERGGSSGGAGDLRGGGWVDGGTPFRGVRSWILLSPDAGRLGDQAAPLQGHPRPWLNVLLALTCAGSSLPLWSLQTLPLGHIFPTPKPTCPSQSWRAEKRRRSPAQRKHPPTEVASCLASWLSPRLSTVWVSLWVLDTHTASTYSPRSKQPHSCSLPNMLAYSSGEWKGKSL